MYFNRVSQTFNHTHDDVVAAVGAQFLVRELVVGDYVYYEYETEPDHNSLTHKAVASEVITERENLPWLRGWDVVPLDAAEAAARLASAQEVMWEKIKGERDRRSDTAGYKVGEHWFHSDQRSKTQQMGLMLMGAAVPAVPWKTMSGAFVTMTQALAQQIFAAAAAADQAVFAAAEAHRATMMALADPREYDWVSNWPPAYWDEA